LICVREQIEHRYNQIWGKKLNKTINMVTEYGTRQEDAVAHPAVRTLTIRVKEFSRKKCRFCTIQSVRLVRTGVVNESRRVCVRAGLSGTRRNSPAARSFRRTPYLPRRKRRGKTIGWDSKK